jgi:glycosyltransferase involved in cell wall biosynthesis
VKVFFICSWYPNKNNPSEGVFLKNMAEAISVYENVTVFHIHKGVSGSSSVEELSSELNGVKTVSLYYKPNQIGLKVWDVVRNSFKEVRLLQVVVKREFKKNRPEIIHFNVVSPLISLAWLYRFFYRVPFVYSEHWDVPLRARRGLIKNWLAWRIGMKLCSLFARQVIVCSNAMKEAFGYYGLSDRVNIISNVVNIHENEFGDNLREVGKKIILHISSLDTAQKNVYGIIDATAKVAESRTDFELHILGKGKEFEALKKYTASLNLLDSIIHFHGFVSDEEKGSYIKKSAFHVLFSNFEGQSVVTAESICYGRPVIATRCGGPEDFVNEQNGMLIEPGNVMELANAIHFMLDNYQKFDPLKLREYGQKIFSPKSVGLKHHDLYAQVVKDA